ncbi:MAG: hypothetical protein KatS3mg031_2240 [Chitinophagales bacterium]|nr:MAG: hypothetical protein KatS3mg031_2240 [Chitinophagales bacterium]
MSAPLVILLIVACVSNAPRSMAQQITLREAKEKYYDGDIQGALSDLSRIIQDNPSNEEAWYERGRIYSEQKKYLQAVQDYTRVIELNPRHHKAFYLRGYAKYMMGNWQGAISDFNLSLELYDNSALAFWYRAESKLKVGDVAGACEDWDKAYRLGYFEATRRISEHCREQQISVNVVASAYLRKGDACLDKKDAKTALEYYQKALELNPESAEVVYSIGLAEQMLGKTKEACDSWQKAAALGSPEAVQMLKQHCR